MKAMILAAGEGRRMRPLTLETPKPLLEAGGRPLIVHQIEKLARAGVRELVINHAWLGEHLEAALGSGADLGVSIAWSREGEPLETAGGIVQALPLLGEGAFIVANADIWTDYSYDRLPELSGSGTLAHLVMVRDAPHKPGGDFYLGKDGLLTLAGEGHALTYSGIGVFHPDFFRGLEPGFRALRPLLDAAIQRGMISGEVHEGKWTDVGTPERLSDLDRALHHPPS